MNFIDTLKGSMLEGFYPSGWDMEKIDECCANPPERINDRQAHWNREFTPVSCENIYDFDMMLGHEIALEIKKSRDEGRKLAMILPVGPMGMYRWAVYFLKEWNVECSHVYGFNMDEWSDGEGNTLDSGDPAAFQNAMLEAFYGPLGRLTVPSQQRNFATKLNLTAYPEKISGLKAEGAKLVTVFGIGRMCHIAFWEPHFAAEFKSVEEWKKQTHRLGAKLHPLTIEQNAITSFKSRTTLVPCRANTIGPALFLQSDKIIGGCDGALGRGMQWQGMSLWVTLRYGPDMWIPSSFMPTKPGKLFYLKELKGPLTAECN
ncbi:MAG: glucosamine-6-phosphate isomerase [Ruminiclostridium sp.]|nr:glucosamine-6-phosphate isomerase [Ruminiclostridium sp.]